MSHLTDREHVDWLDGRLPAARLRHAEACARCRETAAELSAILEVTAADPAPEPSPLFWDHFSARVSAAIGEEPAPEPAGPAWLEWLRHPVSLWAGTAAVVVLMIATVVWRATLHAPSVPAAIQQASTVTPDDDPGTSAAIEDDADADEAWLVVRTAAAGLGWDDADAAGISARPGSAERVALELTADERAELARILESEMKRTGA